MDKKERSTCGAIAISLGVLRLVAVIRCEEVSRQLEALEGDEQGGMLKDDRIVDREWGLIE